MPDEQPPRVSGDERTVLTTLLAYQRASLLRKVDGVDDALATTSPVPSGTSLLWLVNHVADAEATWVLRRFAGQDDGHDAAFGPHEPTLAGACARYRSTCAATDLVIAQSSFDELCRAADRDPVPDLRWVVGHLLEETARHAGHADILRELLDGATGR